MADTTGDKFKEGVRTIFANIQSVTFDERCSISLSVVEQNVLDVYAETQRQHKQQLQQAFEELERAILRYENLGSSWELHEWRNKWLRKLEGLEHG